MASFEAGTLPDLPLDMRDSLRDKAEFSQSVGDAEDYCRICRGEASLEQPLFHPCKCSGSIKYVHQDCLMEWLSHSQKKYCELCKTPFRFTKLYDQSMPSTLPTPLFLRQLLLHAVKGCSRWARYLLVGFIWTCCLPWCIRQIWRGLFWLADGSWLSPEELRTAAMDRLNRTITDSEVMDTSATFAMTNMSLESLDQVLPPAVFFLTELLRFLSGETFIARILRFLFSVPPISLTTSSHPRFANRTDYRDYLDRPPSILSDVQFMRSLTTSDLVNHIFIDVCEGQLICTFLIAAFILVFLIREWVINQQPILNMPDPDLPDNLPQPIPLDNAARPVVRRRRGLLRRGVVPNAAQGPIDLDLGARPMAVPRRRRALTDDNIAVPTRADQVRPDVPIRSMSSAPVRRDAHVDQEDSDGDDEEDAVPPPLTREALGYAVDINRTIEEGSGFSHVERAIERIPSAEPDATRHPHFEVSADQPSASAIMSEEGNDQAHKSRPEIDEQGSSSADDIMQQVSTILDSEEEGITTPASSEIVEATGIPVDEREIVGQQQAEINIPVNHSADEPSAVEKLAAWLWYTEGYIPAPVQAGDEEHVVADVDAEPPFVLAPNREAIVQPARIPQPPGPAPPPQEPNFQLGIDLNDPNAIDDAEDLDGILELIGMEGPLAGMVQNVVFSLFLITLTLAASIWVPYIWGKIALLFLANPIVMFIKVPLHVLSRGADVILDVIFFVFGLVGLLFDNLTKLARLATSPVVPRFSSLLNTDLLGRLSLNLTQSSGTRLEKVLTGTFVNFRPDLPTFSMQSHHTLKVFKAHVASIVSSSVSEVLHFRSLIREESWTISCLCRGVLVSTTKIPQLTRLASSVFGEVAAEFQSLVSDLKLFSLRDPNSIDYSLVQWSAEDKLIAVVLGYCFFATAGLAFLRLAHIFLGLKENEKVGGAIADSLRQAGGVMKVIVIIGIEMIAFPLYCGFLLDMALLPLFEGANFHSRIAFIMRAPFTGIFIHWFIGTCYMFHFALFVSMCRKIMRKGVLYFIRDPDDPTFHPVRDVLERPVPNQLGKIAFSALVYGGLVIMCLGGVIWLLHCIEGVLPIRWATDEPHLAFPADVIFYNFLLPFMLRKAEPSKKIAVIYEWWFRGCASGLRLTHFLFGEEREDEKRPAALRLPWIDSITMAGGDSAPFDGAYVRAPASDSCRIPKGTKVFLEVNANNERLDGQPDPEEGVHGKSDDRFAKIYIPPHFKARIAAFLLMLWIFAATTGVACTVGPLLLGRQIIRLLAGTQVPSNDLYAVTVGLHLLAAIACAVAYRNVILDWLRHQSSNMVENIRQVPPFLWTGSKYLAGMFYLAASIGVVLPFVLSLISELYIHIPLATYLLSTDKIAYKIRNGVEKPSPAVFVLQTWTLGLLYLRLALRIALNYPSRESRPATAIRAIVRNGYLHPDIRLASRAVILPTTALCIVLLASPLVYAKIVITLLRIHDAERQMQLYRFAYPGLLGVGLVLYGFVSVKQKVAVWQGKVRDEVYLIGERLHNFHDVKVRRGTEKGKGKEKML